MVELGNTIVDIWRMLVLSVPLVGLILENNGRE